MTSCSTPRSRTSTTSSSGGFAGSITAALFLRRFVSARQSVAAFRHLCLESDDASPVGPKAASARQRARSMRCWCRAMAERWTPGGALDPRALIRCGLGRMDSRA